MSQETTSSKDRIFRTEQNFTVLDDDENEVYQFRLRIFFTVEFDEPADPANYDPGSGDEVRFKECRLYDSEGGLYLIAPPPFADIACEWIDLNASICIAVARDKTA